MSTRPFDPRRLDVAAFAAEAAELEGRWPVVDFGRLRDAIAPERPPTAADEVVWQARGERRASSRAGGETWLHLHAATGLAMTCQRCLAPVEVPLRVARNFLFVAGEDAAAKIDAESEDDVLALTRSLDLRQLIEDELLLALPIVALHEVCPEPLVVAEDPPAEARENPFAALAGLKGRGALN
jgi:uncharacterized protein